MMKSLLLAAISISLSMPAHAGLAGDYKQQKIDAVNSQQAKCQKVADIKRSSMHFSASHGDYYVTNKDGKVYALGNCDGAYWGKIGESFMRVMDEVEYAIEGNELVEYIKNTGPYGGTVHRNVIATRK